MKANEKQVGGDHYISQYQHWDLVVDNDMGYLEGNATKYISRYKAKNGVEDLKKAKHYLEKILEVSCIDYNNLNKMTSSWHWVRNVGSGNMKKFLSSRNYDEFQTELFHKISEWKTPDDVRNCIELLEKYIMSLDKAGGTTTQ